MEARLRAVEERLVASGVAVRRGGDTEPWDLEVRTGAFASARLIGTVEEHGSGRPDGPLAGVAARLERNGGTERRVGACRAWAYVDGALLAAVVGATLVGVTIARAILDAGRGVEALRVASEPSRAAS